MPAGLFNGRDCGDSSPAPGTKRKASESSSSKSNKKQKENSPDTETDGAAEVAKSKTKMPVHRHLDNCSVIARNERGEYVELRCDMCGGNSGRNTKGFLYGIIGFSAHYRYAHNESLSPADIFQRCSVRAVLMDEVHEIESGGQYSTKALPHKNSTPNRLGLRGIGASDKSPTSLYRPLV